MTHQAGAISYGAISVVNAIATGKGAALGVDLWTKASVRLTNKPGEFQVLISRDKREDQTLAKLVAKRVLQKFGVHKRFGARVKTEGNIPIARGLKSSSSAANAIALATVAALGERLPDQELIRICVDCNLDAGVSITGAFDDACACYYGGFVATDNVRRKMILRKKIRPELPVLIAVPTQKSYTGKMEPQSFDGIHDLVDAAFAKAVEGKIWDALTLNGIIHATALDYDPAPIIESIRRGALAAGLSGKGPAIAAVIPNRSHSHQIERVLSRVGRVIRARLNSKRAHVLS